MGGGYSEVYGSIIKCGFFLFVLDFFGVFSRFWGFVEICIILFILMGFEMGVYLIFRDEMNFEFVNFS